MVKLVPDEEFPDEVLEEIRVLTVGSPEERPEDIARTMRDRWNSQEEP